MHCRINILYNHIYIHQVFYSRLFMLFILLSNCFIGIFLNSDRPPFFNYLFFFSFSYCTSTICTRHIIYTQWTAALSQKEFPSG